MVYKSIKMSMLFAAIVASAIFPAVTISSCNGDNTENPNQAPQQANKPRPKDRPIIIWHYSSMRDSIESLRLALSSGLITHVSVGGLLHRKDRDYKKNVNALEAIKIAKKSGVKLIWCRWLWPGYGIERSRAEDLFEPNYYIREIQAVRAEAKAVGADFVALDTEPYAKSPMRTYWRGERPLKARDRERLSLAIKKVVNRVGKADFILPAGWRGNKMPYDILAKLGANRISESTFYSNYKRIKNIKTPYEIFGAYLNTTRKNEAYPTLPYFLVPEIFENSYLWSDRKGLFLYSRENRATAVARVLVEYSRNLPYAKTKHKGGNKKE